MTQRLQVLLEEAEMKEVRRAARARHMTVAEWVRDALRAARRRQPQSAPDRKLAVVRAASRHALPTAEIDRMLADIERGYRTGDGA
jgi:hypothetical protein